MRFLLLPGMDGTGDLFEPFLSVLPAGVEATVISYPRDRKLSYEQLEESVWEKLPSEPFVIVVTPWLHHHFDGLDRAPDEVHVIDHQSG